MNCCMRISNKVYVNDIFWCSVRRTFFKSVLFQKKLVGLEIIEGKGLPLQCLFSKIWLKRNFMQIKITHFRKFKKCVTVASLLRFRLKTFILFVQWFNRHRVLFYFQFTCRL